MNDDRLPSSPAACAARLLPLLLLLALPAVVQAQFAFTTNNGAITITGYNGAGGLILAPAHVLGPETPWENIVAFFEAADEMTTS